MTASISEISIKTIDGEGFDGTDKETGRVEI
jgi:hypothetical protein